MTENEAINALGILDQACYPRFTDDQAKVVKRHMLKGTYCGIARPLARRKGCWTPSVMVDVMGVSCVTYDGKVVPASYDRKSHEQLERMYPAETEEYCNAPR